MKIFYSWQSDLPGSENRYFIQECIEKAASTMRNVINVEVDRDTKNELGSPDIVNTIFAKIDECDLFVADISIINSAFKDDPNARMTPNPNVMLELGYAACKLGWDRVICLFNSDISEIDSLPFDIRQRRITPYSIKLKGKAAERNRIADILSDTLKAMQKSGGLVRPKEHYALHKVFGLNPSSNQFEEAVHLHPIPLSTLKSEMIAEATDLLEQIQNIGVTHKASAFFNDELSYLDAIASLGSSMGGYRDIEVSDDEVEEVISAIKKLLGKELDKSILYFGGLQIRHHPLNGGCEYRGRDSEIEKYEKYMSLKRKLSELHVLNLFSAQFANLNFIPLAIKNVANVPDKNLRIFIEIINNNCETIVPSEDLLGSELIKTGGYICNYGLISKMFAVDGGYLVSFDDDEVPDYEDDNPYINIWDCSPSRDSEECVEELCEYLATPVAKGVYEFSLSSLRPNEIKWLGKWILVRNGNENIRLKYNVTSEVTDGTVSGVIEQKTSAEK